MHINVGRADMQVHSMRGMQISAAYWSILVLQLLSHRTGVLMICGVMSGDGYSVGVSFSLVQMNKIKIVSDTADQSTSLDCWRHPSSPISPPCQI